MQYLLCNAPMQTINPPAAVPVGSPGTKTMLQFKPIVPCRIVEWGYSFDGNSAGVPGKIELIETGTVFGTVTAYAAQDITKFDAEAVLFGDPTANFIGVGVNASGYTCTIEGVITTVRNLQAPQLTAPTNEFLYQYPLGYRAFCQANNCVRIRMAFPAAVNALCYLIVEF